LVEQSAHNRQDGGSIPPSATKKAALSDQRWVTHPETARRIEGLRKLVAKLEAEHGEVTEEEMRAVRLAWDGDDDDEDGEVLLPPV
jgi:hypothetical protein